MFDKVAQEPGTKLSQPGLYNKHHTISHFAYKIINV